MSSYSIFFKLKSNRVFILHKSEMWQWLYVVQQRRVMKSAVLYRWFSTTILDIFSNVVVFHTN